MSVGDKVVVSGWYGAGNIGDELLLASFVGWVKAHGGVVTAISIDPAHTKAMHGIDAVDFNDLAAISSVMADADTFALGGGGLLQTHNAFTFSALYDFDNTADVATYARVLLLAKQFGLKTLMWAQGVGPLDGEQARQIVSGLLTVTDAITVRDEASRAILKELGAAQTIACAPDPVWAADLPVMSLPERSTHRVGLVIRPWAAQPEWRRILVDAVRQAFAGTGRTLVWIPYQSHSVPGRSDSDLGLIDEMIAELGDGFVHEVAAVQTLGEALAAMASCGGLVAMRLHAQILGARLGLPMLGIEYDAKMAYNAEVAGFSPATRLSVDASEEQWASAMQAFAATVASGSPAVAEDRVQQLAELSLAHRDALWDVLSIANKPARSWLPGGFDWSGSWQAQQSRRTIDDQVMFIRHMTVKGQDQLDSLIASHQRANELHDKALKQLGIEVQQKQELLDRTQLQLDQRQGEIDKLVAGISRLALLAQGKDEIEGDGEQDLAQIALMLSERTLLAHESVRRDLEASKESACEAQRALNNERIRAEQNELAAQRLQNQLQAVRESSSWRITRPLRSLFRLARDPREELVLLRQWLARKRRPQLDAASVATETPAVTDLSWAEFEKTVLARRNQYKGVFIQEVVIDWQVPLYQRPQHISAAMAKHGCLVIYRTVNWAGDDVRGFREVLPDVWLTDRDEVDGIVGAVRSVYSTAYAKSPHRFSEIGRSNVMMYEYIDHIDPQISGDEDNIRRLLQQKDWAFSGGADVVVASANALQEEAVAAVGASKVLVVKNGVDTEHYRAEKHVAYPLPDHVSQFKQRHSLILGYFGALAPWLWYEGIAELVARRKDIGFIFIGPDYYGGAERLPNADNVLYLGPIDYKVLPAYARAFDICFIPFEKGEIARTTSPLKLFEYFALEKPVVVTAWMNECVAHPEVFRGDSVDALERAIDAAAVAKDDPAVRRRYAEMADENSWYSRAATMADAFKLLPRR